jgi:Fic family protein
MKSFENNYIEKIHLTPSLVKTIRVISEFMGKQDLYKKQSPQLLKALKQNAIIQSTESSNRIEGITAPINIIKSIVAEKVKPSNRSEQEIAGYRDVLNTIHLNYEYIPVSENIVLQFHKQLYGFTSAQGGYWKITDNEITEKRADGKTYTRFKTVSAFQTSDYMKNLHEKYNEKLKEGEIDSLVLIPAYVLDFLCIHPFLDGNGRMSRLLTLLLLYQAGIEVGKFISLEKIIENSKESYYDALYKSSQKWHTGKHNIIPWTEYFYGIVLAAYKEFENRVGIITDRRGGKYNIVLEVLNNIRGEFTVSKLQELCPTVKIDWIRKILKEEKLKGNLILIGKGRDSKWKKTN